MYRFHLRILLFAAALFQLVILPFLTILLYLYGTYARKFAVPLEGNVNHLDLSVVDNVNRILDAKFGGNRTYRDSALAPVAYLIVPTRMHIQQRRILVLVPSDVKNRENRNIWRRTYGHPRNKEKFGYTAIFCVGTSHDPSDESRLLDEALDYGDILQADFVDSYRNLTIKMLTAIRYVVIAAREAKSVFKVDDDVSWRIRSVTAYIHNVVNSKACSFHCYRHEAGGAPPRNKWRKWYTTVEEYPFKTLPTYCLGWSYIATLPALDAVLSRVHLERFLWLEDVFISGVLNQNVAEVVGIDKRRYFRNKSDFRLFPKAWFYHLQHRNITIERGYTILNKSY
ncbi:hypothetical protein Y032_0384g409 [Ancylostoma ceylanicum]|nr:hypothetical protein Y032_0384g409 [Ancylostoma ceylanicum]